MLHIKTPKSGRAKRELKKIAETKKRNESPVSYSQFAETTHSTQTNFQFKETNKQTNSDSSK